MLIIETKFGIFNIPNNIVTDVGNFVSYGTLSHCGNFFNDIVIYNLTNNIMGA